MIDIDYKPFFIFLPLLIKIIFLLFFCLVIINWDIICSFFKNIKKRTWLILLLITIIGFLLRLFWISHGQMVFYDGFNWVSMAMSIEGEGIYGLCEIYFNNSCYYYTFHSWPPAFHTFLSVFFKVFHSGEITAFYVSLFLGTLMIPLSFLLSYLWTKKENIALLGSMIFGLLPPILKFSGGVSLQFFSVFFLLITLIFLEMLLHNKNKKLFFLVLVSLLLVVYSRPEHIILIPIFIFSIALRGDVKKCLSKKDILLIIGSFFVLIVPALFLLYYGTAVMKYDGWTASFVDTINYFLKHLPQNLYFFVNPLFNSVVFTVFALIGTLVVFMKEKKVFFFYAILLLFYFAFYTAFDMGEFYKNEIRYSLILYVPLFFFFIKSVSYFYGKIKNGKYKMLLLVFLLILFLLSILSAITYIKQEEKLATVIDVLHSGKEMLPDNHYIISNSSAIIRSTINKNVVASYFFFNNDNDRYFNFKNKQFFLLIDSLWEYDYYKDMNFIYNNYELNPLIIDYDGYNQKIIFYKLLEK